MDHNLVNMQQQFCSEHNVDTNACISLGVHCDGVPYAKGTHKQMSTEVYGSSHTRRALVVVTALPMLCKVMDHLWDPTKAAKWSKQLAANYVQLSESDASGTHLHDAKQLFEYMSVTCGYPTSVCENMDEECCGCNC